MHWSEDILREVQKALVEGIGRTNAESLRVVDAMRNAFPECCVAGYQPFIPVMPVDEGDRHVVAAAVATKSEVIVTTNLKHFPANALAGFNIEAQHPDEILTNLFDLNPGRMVEIIRQQAQALNNPPKTVEDILEGLSLHAPSFVQFIQAYIDEEDS